MSILNEPLEISERAWAWETGSLRRQASIIVAAELRRIAPYLCEDDSISLQIRANELDPQ